MPELPEVETTCRGIRPLVTDQTIVDAVVRERRLRWPVTAGLAGKLAGQRVARVWRRAKYLLLTLDHGTLIVHLGMSGHLSIVESDRPADKHDHVDICLASGVAIRFHDPRRFGAMLWTKGDPLQHKLLAGLGPEPLGGEFSGEYLFDKTRGRRRGIRNTLLDGRIIAGVGNIYANEALFIAGIDPRRAAGRIGLARLDRLAIAIGDVLAAAIHAGGTTLRDFRGGDGRPGYFQQQLSVYGRAGLPCTGCGRALASEVQGGRSLFFCRNCQK